MGKKSQCGQFNIKDHQITIHPLETTHFCKSTYFFIAIHPIVVKIFYSEPEC